MNPRKRTRPNLSNPGNNQDAKTSGGFSFRNNPTINFLNNNTTYFGEIINCVDTKSQQGNEMAVLTINVDGKTLPFEIKCVYECAHVFMKFLYDLDQELGRKAVEDDLIGLQIEFSVLYNGTFPNFTNLYTIEEVIEDDQYEDAHKPELDHPDSERDTE